MTKCCDAHSEDSNSDSSYVGCGLVCPQRRYWCAGSGVVAADEELEMSGQLEDDNFERNPRGVPAGIRIRQLRKVRRPHGREVSPC